MEYSDDKLNTDGMPVNTEQAGNDGENVANVDERFARDAAPVASEKSERNEISGGTDGSVAQNASGADALIGIAVKAIAVTLSIILLITSLVAVAAPFSAMRVFNGLGMPTRAIDFGERYIMRELGKYDAQTPDDKGNYVTLGNTPELTTAAMDEALYVCIYDSYKLMNECYEFGDSRTGEYYADINEKYTRMYLSLNNVSGLNASRSAKNVAAMPLAAMRPAVYSYGNTMRAMNFRARSFLGETDYSTGAMLFNSNASGNAVTAISERTETLYGIDIKGKDRSNLMSNIDWYIDYIGELSEYLDVQYILAGVENDLSAKVMLDGIGEISIVTEPAVNKLYRNILSGTEFALLLSRESAFTRLYQCLKRFNEYAQIAVDFMPSDANNNKLDEQLHKLYWLNTLSKFSRQMMYTEMLLYYNSEMYGGVTGEKIRAEYGIGVWQNQSWVMHGGIRKQLTAVYAEELKSYIIQYQS